MLCCSWLPGSQQFISLISGENIKQEIKSDEWDKEAQERGAGEILFTSMTHDGVKTGYANEALFELNKMLTIPVIASGGAGTKEHFKDAFELGHADAALAASVFHFGEIPINELKEYLAKQGIPIRI